MAQVIVREATAADFAAVGALLVELGRPQTVGVSEQDRHEQAWAAYLAGPDTFGIVAEIDRTVVGFCDLEFRTRLGFLRPFGWIPDLIVTEAARGTGAGRALLARAEEIARARGAWGMSLESARWREASHEFYRHVGWDDTGLAFTRSLTAETWPPPPPGSAR